MTLRAVEGSGSDMSAILTKKQLRVIARKDLQREQTNVLAVADPRREIEELPEGLQTGHVKRRKRGARSDRDCIDEICDIIASGITAKAAWNTLVYRGRRGNIGVEIMLRMRVKNLLLLTSATSTP